MIRVPSQSLAGAQIDTTNLLLAFLSHSYLTSPPATGDLTAFACILSRAIPLRTCPVTDTNKRTIAPPILPLTFTLDGISDSACMINSASPCGGMNRQFFVNKKSATERLLWSCVMGVERSFQVSWFFFPWLSIRRPYSSLFILGAKYYCNRVQYYCSVHDV
jgi:hypothetical protein